MFLTESVLLGAGHDFNPTIVSWSNSKGGWAVNSQIDREEAAAASEEGSNVSKARELFRSKTVRGQESKADSDILKTKHERCITCICNATPAGSAEVNVVSTTSTDGKLVMWNFPSLDINFANLNI